MGEDRIALELKAKLGVEHAPSTIRWYMVLRKGDGRPVSSRWSTFLTGHASELWTMDLTTQPLWNYSMRYVLVLMELRSRRVVHVAVTASPTLAWVKQQVREATPFGSVPRFLVHDNDGIFGQFGTRRPGKTGRSYPCSLDLWLGEVLHSKGIPIPYGAPNAAARIERFMGSLKRECLNHFIFLWLAPAGTVIPGRAQLPNSDLHRAQRAPFVRRLIPQESRQGHRFHRERPITPPKSPRMKFSRSTTVFIPRGSALLLWCP